MSCTGTVKSFNPVKSFGFIEFQGVDLFVHLADCLGGMPKQGDVVAFDVQDSEKKPGSKVAKNVTGGSGAMKGVMGNGSSQGTVKSFNPIKGFGFIICEGQDVFCHIRDCEGGCPQTGDTVAFDIEESPSKPGSKKASNVTGGTGNLEPAGGGKGKGWDSGYGPMWGGKGGFGGAGPYGKGGGKGKGWGKMSWW